MNKPYDEKVHSTFNLRITRQHEIDERIKDKKQRQMLLGQRGRAMSAVSQRPPATGQGEESGGLNTRMRNFNKMSINELRQHEKGILNLYESQLAIAKMISHNKVDNAGNLFDIKLTQLEYDSIFEHPPSF